MTFRETRINTGGLMRCCIHTIEEYIEAHSTEECTDLVIDCMHEKPGNKQIKLENGTWKWNKTE
jgi:hypothetical protein